MEYMFWYAYAIKQDLCHWRFKNFPFALSNGIFGGSGCLYRDSPVDTSSSFCQSQCSESIDIGPVGIAGSSVMNNGEFVIKGSGSGKSLKSGYQFF